VKDFLSGFHTQNRVSGRPRVAEMSGDDVVFYLFVQKQKIALRHIPLEYSSPRNKGKCAICLAGIEEDRKLVSAHEAHKLPGGK
jgi:hypothetical protein